MKKMLVIESCIGCDNLKSAGDILSFCEKTWKTIKNVETIHPDCPLPDYEDTEKQSEKFVKACGIIRKLVHDLETPHRWGLGEPVNPDWDAFNMAKDFIKGVANEERTM